MQKVADLIAMDRGLPVNRGDESFMLAAADGTRSDVSSGMLSGAKRMSQPLPQDYKNAMDVESDNFAPSRRARLAEIDKFAEIQNTSLGKLDPAGWIKRADTLRDVIAERKQI